MENKINYHKEMLSMLDGIDEKDHKKILLHTCCGPCFTIPYEYLKDKFEITLFFNNSNIYPKEEHDRRLEELKKYIASLNTKINLIVQDYDYDNFVADFKGLENEKEGQNRCFICYSKRLIKTFEYADKYGFDYVGSVMSISRYKNAQMLNKIGENLMKKYPKIKWFFADFKKENGYQKSLKIVSDFGMYKQDYCGCEFSIKNREKIAKK